MEKPEVEWDPSWNEDWEAGLEAIEEEIEEGHLVSPQKAVELYRYGYSAGRKEPSRDWPEVESDLYEDFMTGMDTPDEAEEEWQESRDWAQRGWESTRVKG